MGYYTGVSLSIISGPKEQQREAAEFLDTITEESDYDTWGWLASLETRYAKESDDYSWYENMKIRGWEDSIEKLSMQFPDVTFHMDCDGEEPDDIWIAYIREGVSIDYMGKVVYGDEDWVGKLHRAIAG